VASILRIERINYAIGGALIVAAAVTQPRDVSLGVAIGVALTCLNFHILRRLITKWTAAAAKGEPSNAPMLMLPKMVGLMGAVALAILFLPIQPVAFIVGYSIFMVSIVIDTTFSALRPAATDDQHG
jgi:hypothetical protein